MTGSSNNRGKVVHSVFWRSKRFVMSLCAPFSYEHNVDLQPHHAVRAYMFVCIKRPIFQNYFCECYNIAGHCHVVIFEFKPISNKIIWQTKELVRWEQKCDWISNIRKYETLDKTGLLLCRSVKCNAFLDTFLCLFVCIKSTSTEPLYLYTKFGTTDLYLSIYRIRQSVTVWGYTRSAQW